MADTKRILCCPACGAIMTKIYVPDGNIDLDFCIDGCGGIFFDGTELERVKDNEEISQELLELAQSKFFNHTDEANTRICPVCNVPMRKHVIDLTDLEIDICDKCGGKFLDNGEFQKVRDFKKLSSLLS